VTEFQLDESDDAKGWAATSQGMAPERPGAPTNAEVWVTSVTERNIREGEQHFLTRKMTGPPRMRVCHSLPPYDTNAIFRSHALCRPMATRLVEGGEGGVRDSIERRL
jgi:hypothetical protein